MDLIFELLGPFAVPGFFRIPHGLCQRFDLSLVITQSFRIAQVTRPTEISFRPHLRLAFWDHFQAYPPVEIQRRHLAFDEQSLKAFQSWIFVISKMPKPTLI